MDHTWGSGYSTWAGYYAGAAYHGTGAAGAHTKDGAYGGPAQHPGPMPVHGGRNAEEGARGPGAQHAGTGAHAGAHEKNKGGGGKGNKGSKKGKGAPRDIPINFDVPDEEALPIDHFKRRIVRHFLRHRITCIQGDTGCGKSTRVPVYLKEVGGFIWYGCCIGRSKVVGLGSALRFLIRLMHDPRKFPRDADENEHIEKENAK